MDNNKRKLVVWIVVIVAVAGFFALVWVLGRGDRGSGTPEIITTIDPDTGDEVITVPGKEPEFNPSPGPTIFGGGKMVASTAITDSQYRLVETIVVDYALKNVGADVKAVKFLPETVQLVASTPAGIPYQYKVQVKTENPEALLDTTINLVGLDRVKVVIVYPNKPELGTFDSGIQPFDGGGISDEGDH